MRWHVDFATRLICLQRTTIRTIKNFYYSRNPLEDLLIKHEDYYPFESDTVEQVLDRNSWGKRVIALHAIALEEGAAQPTLGYSRGTQMDPVNVEDDEDDGLNESSVEAEDEDQHTSVTSISADGTEIKPHQRILKHRGPFEGAAEVDTLLSTTRRDIENPSSKKRRLSSPKLKKEPEIVEIEDDGDEVEIKQERVIVEISDDGDDDSVTDEESLERDKHLNEAMHIRDSEDFWDAELRRCADKQLEEIAQSANSTRPTFVKPTTAESQNASDTVQTISKSGTTSDLYSGTTVDDKSDKLAGKRVLHSAALKSRLALLPETSRAAILAAETHSCGACGGAMELKTYTHFDTDNQPLCGDCSRCLLVAKGDQYAIHRLDNDRIAEWSDNLMEDVPDDSPGHCDGDGEELRLQEEAKAGPSWLGWGLGTVINGINNISKRSFGTTDSRNNYRYPTTDIDSATAYASLRPVPVGIDPNNLWVNKYQGHVSAKQGSHTQTAYDKDNDSDGDYMNFTFPDPEDDFVNRDYQLPTPAKSTPFEVVSAVPTEPQLSPTEHGATRHEYTHPRITKLKYPHSLVATDHQRSPIGHRTLEPNHTGPRSSKLKISLKPVPAERDKHAHPPSPPASLISDDDDNVDHEAVEKAMATTEDEDDDWEPESTSVSHDDGDDGSDSGSEGHGGAGASGRDAGGD